MSGLDLGSTFAGCLLEELAGRGGMGVVYRARQLALERPVAVKVISPELAGDPEYRERFVRESRLAASIEHAHVLPVYETGEWDGSLYLISRWVQGRDLGVLLASEGRVAPERAVALLAPVARALGAAHRRGLVHGDVKPANVLIASAGNEAGGEHVYLSDFGVARRAVGEEPLTRTGVLVGSLGYMAPERIEGALGDAAGDIYAFGCMLFESLVGHVPFERQTDLERLQAHLHDPVPSARVGAPDVPVALEEVITRAMAKRPEQRFGSAEELAAALERSLTEPGERASGVEFRLLGPLEVLRDGRPLDLGALRQRALLALLLVRANEAVSSERLIEELWGERAPASAPNMVQVYVSRLRKALGSDEGPVTQPPGYLLKVATGQVDALRFEALIAHAREALEHGDPGEARKSAAQAIALWRGPPLAEFSQFEFANRASDRLEELRASAQEASVEAALACGEHAQAINTLTSLVAANPLREQPRRLLMLALYRSGRHAEALAAYRDARAALDEIGLQPGPEIRALEDAILRHDPALTSGRAAGDTQTSEPAAEPGAEERPAAEETPADVGPTRRQSRKVVTALFCDVTSSTTLGEELDPEALHGVMNRYFRELRAVIERHGGTVEKFIGDAVMAVFGIPQVREDDALRAIRAAAEIRARLPSVAVEIGVALSFRTGVSTGLVLVGEGENIAIGDATNLAARLEQAAAPGEILLGEETLRLVRGAVEVEPLEPLDLKGKSEPVLAFRLLSVDPVAPGLRRHFEMPLVGRARELALLRGAWERAVQESGCHLLTLLGAAGVGKSRLVSELLDAVNAEATVLSGRCLHYGEGITFWPLIEALAPVGEPASRVLDRLESGGAATPEELFWEVRRLLEALALDRPVILHIDDLQWAEPTLLDLLDHVADLSRDSPILLLCTARPDLLEERPAWSGGKLSATTVRLQPLDAPSCDRLLDELGDGLMPDARARVIAASDGNPLFLEEMAALAREQHTLSVPSTIQALLAARLERLPEQERELLELAAVEGEVFHLTALRALASERIPGDLQQRLTGLVRKELIRPHPAHLKGDQAFRFRHILARDGAYDALPKASRAYLHERFATWLEQEASDLPELDEIAGWHLEQTVRYLRELGRRTEPALSRRAAEHLHAAGRRAAARADTAAARNLLERAYALAPDGETILCRIGVDLAEQLIEADDLTRVDELLSAAEQNSITAAQARLTRFEWLFIARPKEAMRTIESTLPHIIEQLHQAGDERGLARARLVAVLVHWSACKAALAAEQALLAAQHAFNAGDNGLRSRAFAMYLAALQFGPQDADTISEKLDAIERSDPAPYVAANVKAVRAELARFAGSFDEARRLIRETIEELQAMGIHSQAAAYNQTLAETELSAREHPSALAALLEADAKLAKIAERGHRSTIHAMLARVYELLGDRTAARAAIALAEDLGGPDDVTNYTITHAVRARLALAAGHEKAAERWARSAVEHACQTDFPESQARTRLELARVLAALGRHEEARSEAGAALVLYQGKGHRPGASDARALLSSVSAPA